MSEEKKKIQKVKLDDVIISSSTYDEMKFIDDWISYIKTNDYDKIPIKSLNEKVYDDDSSFSSVMNFYMDEKPNTYVSDDDGIESISMENNVKQEDNESQIESVDLCDMSNIANAKSALSKLECEDLNSDTEEKTECLNNNNLSHTLFSSRESISSNIIKKKPSEKSEIRNDTIIPDEKINANVSKKTNTEKNVILKNVKLVNKQPTKNVNVVKTIIDSKVVIDKYKDSPQNTNLNFSEIEKTCERNFDLSVSTFAYGKNLDKTSNFFMKRSNSDIPLRRFVIETEEVMVKLNETDKLCDLRSKIIAGKLSKRNTKGYFNYNWFTLRETFFNCYNGKSKKIDANNVPLERNGDIIHPDDKNSFLTKKYTIDLLQAKIFLSKKRGKKDIFTCYSEGFPAEIDMVDITNMTILNVQKMNTEYKIFLRNECGVFDITLNCLNFCLKSNDGYRFYKLEKIDEFLKWMIAFKFRLGKIQLRIG